MRMPRHIPLGALALPVALGLSQCGKKETPPATGTPPAAVAPEKPSAGLAGHAAALGFAGRLPVDTEFYFGSPGLKQHLDALKKSAFYKEISALANDKTPAPAAGDKTVTALRKLWGDEMFIAGGAGMAEFSTWFRRFNRLYNELNFRMLMTGSAFKPAAKPGEKRTAFNPAILLQSLLADPAQLDRATDVIAGLELPPILIGFKVGNAAEVARDVLPEEFLAKAPPDKFTVGSIKTPDGGAFRTLSTDGSKLLADDLKQQMLAGLPAAFNESSRKTIEKLLAEFQKKKFAFAWGAVGDYAIFALGKNFDHVEFTNDPGASFLSKPELAQLAPYVAKKLLGLAYISAGTLGGLMDDQPFTPVLRGIFGAMKENPMFGNLGAVLDRQLADYTPAEVALFKREVTTQAAAVWWDHGIHVEGFGGVRSKAFEPAKSLQYARVIDQPGVVAAFVYQRSLPFEKFQREWLEKLFGMIYTAAQELVKAGIAGPKGGQTFAMFESLVLPALKKVYAADRELAEKGLGGEAAFVIDVNGKMPSLPGIPIEAKDMKFPRITTISEVANRTAVAASWKKINDSISETIGVIAGGGAGSGDKTGNPAGAPTPGLVLPDPITSEKNGVTSYFYGLPFFAGDLLPCASINDKMLLLSTSKDCAESFAGELSKPAAPGVDGLVWKLDLSALVDWGVSAAKLAPKKTPESEKGMKQFQKWAKPFHAMRGRMFMESSVPRQSFTWEITDLVSFD